MILNKKTILSLLFLGLIIIFFKPGTSPNFLLIAFAFFQSTLLYLLVAGKFRSRLMRKIVLLGIPILIGLFVVGGGIYKDTFKVTNLEKNILWEREELYRRELGVVGRNNFGNMAIEKTKLVLDKITQKITEPYEISHYFSAEDFSFYPLLFFPLFALGFILLLSRNVNSILYYLGLATVGAILVPPHMAYWIFIPLVDLALLLGLGKILSYLKYKKK